MLEEFPWDPWPFASKLQQVDKVVQGHIWQHLIRAKVANSWNVIMLFPELKYGPPHLQNQLRSRVAHKTISDTALSNFDSPVSATNHRSLQLPNSFLLYLGICSATSGPEWSSDCCLFLEENKLMWAEGWERKASSWYIITLHCYEKNSIHCCLSWEAYIESSPAPPQRTRLQAFIHQVPSSVH